MKNILLKIVAILCIVHGAIILSSQDNAIAIPKKTLLTMQQANTITAKIHKFKIESDIAKLKAQQNYNNSIPVNAMQQSINLVSTMYAGDTKIDGNLQLSTKTTDDTYIQHTVSNGMIVRSSHFDTRKPQAILKQVTLYNYIDSQDVTSLQSTQDFYIDTNLPNKNSWADQSSLHNVTQVTTSRIDGKTIVQTINSSNNFLKWHADKTGSFGYQPSNDQIEKTMVTSLQKPTAIIAAPPVKRGLFYKNSRPTRTYFNKITGMIIHADDELITDSDLEDMLQASEEIDDENGIIQEDDISDIERME